MSLAATQRAFQAQILDEDISLPENWGPRVAAGLAIYRNAYRSRLADALRETFPRTLLWVGEGSFARAAAHHIISHPPSSWSLDDAGEGFPHVLGQLFADDPDVEEIAWLEWAMHRAFVAQDRVALDAIGFADLTADFADEDWADLRLAIVPGLAIRQIVTDCAAIWNSPVAEQPPLQEYLLAEPAALIVWRQGRLPVFRSATAMEGRCIELVRAGMTFGDLCEILSGQLGTEQGTIAAGTMLGRWIEDGLVADVRR